MTAALRKESSQKDGQTAMGLCCAYIIPPRSFLGDVRDYRRHLAMQAMARSQNTPSRGNSLKPATHQIPNEILGHIFTLGCPDPAPGRGEVDPRPYQVLVCSICRLWRGVAHGTPALWTTVFIELPFHNCNLNEAFLREALERSGV